MNLRARAQEIATKIVEATADHDFESFVIGFAREEAYDRERHEKRYRKLKIEVSAQLLRHWPQRRIHFLRPDVRIDVSEDLVVAVHSSPLFVAGRYRKLSRAIPSSRWVHHFCHGRGCESCGWSGNLCGPSVQEIVAAAVETQVGGRRTFFHALGREDTDARTLGQGRPFVLEVEQPRRRLCDLKRLALDVLRVGDGVTEVLALSLVGPRAVAQVKRSPAEKSYRAWIRLQGPAPGDAGERAAALAGASIDQLSPTRVMHRRGRDRSRRKGVIDSVWLGEVGGLYVWEVRAEAGTYIKELVSGDGGRTRPSLSETLGMEARCEALDVLEIHWQGPWERTPDPVPTVARVLLESSADDRGRTRPSSTALTEV
jgi:tRNA pseudouridine synthase 10